MPEIGSTVLRANPLEDPTWDSQLAALPAATFFHGAAWARVLNATYGYVPSYFVGSGNGSFRSLIPLLEVDSRLTGRRGISLPFTDECEPLAVSEDGFRSAFDEAIAYARKREWRYLELRGGRKYLGDAPASTSFYGHRLELNANETSVFERIDPATKRSIRKAEQSGLTIEFSRDQKAVGEFYGLLCKTRRRLGVPPQPFSFFREIHRHVLDQNKGWIVLARLGEVPVASAVFFRSKNTSIYKFGASDDRFQHLRANNLVMWRAIKKSIAEGLQSLDFGRTSLSNYGLRRFKLGWGTSEAIIDYVRFDLRENRFIASRDASSGWHSAIFRILPSSLSRLIGMTLYKHIA